MNLRAIRDGIDEIVGAIPCDPAARFDLPTHFIKGENSKRITEDDLTLINRHFPGHELITIANAGHWPHAENAKEFFAKLSQLLP